MNRLKLLRARTGMSQRELAKRTGVSQPRISKLENTGVRHSTRAQTLHRLADGLGVEVEELFDDSGTPLAV